MFRVLLFNLISSLLTWQDSWSTKNCTSDVL